MMPASENLLRRRRELLGPGVPTFYADPVHIVRGKGAWLWDNQGKRYLDCYNNVAHVGHCHPKVVEAIAKQAATLNTHTRYLHTGILDYVENLVGRFADPLSSAVMVCSGSEANDVALRMAREVTGKTGIIATDNTYHGNTALVSQLGSRIPPVGGYAPEIRRVPAPIGQVTSTGKTDPEESEGFAKAIAEAIDDLNEKGFGLAALILCPFFANEGFPAVEIGFLSPALKHVRKAGALTIADEVQPGFGRLGSHFWGHERSGFQPDIVTLGKPMANGHPVAAVVTTSEILSEFRQAYSYFNTFGGNPVSMAAAAATLAVIDDEGLVERARETGTFARNCLVDISGRHAALRSVRGTGLFFGAEILDREGNADRERAAALVEAMRKEGVLLNVTGRHRNVLKIRPPLAIGKSEVELLIEKLDRVLASLS